MSVTDISKDVTRGIRLGERLVFTPVHPRKEEDR
jgi:hypothetical protein